MPPACAVEGVGDLDAQRQNRFQLHRAIADQVLQRDTVEELHDEEGAIAFLANVVNRTDVGMIQRRRGLGFAPKAL
jgi:hypothetical protein